MNSRNKTLVVGLGETGLSAARFLSRENVDFCVVDNRVAPPEYRAFKMMFPKIDFRLGPFVRDDFLCANEIILSPGVPLSTPEVSSALASGVSVIGDVELFARHIDSERAVVAITGTNGKSTVTALVAAMAQSAGLRVLAGGNFGPPALDLFETTESIDLYVLELSSFQLETTHSLKLAVSVVLNITEDHGDRYQSLEEYANVKWRIHKNSKAAVVNREESFAPDMNEISQVISFGLDAPTSKAAGKAFGLAEHKGRPWIAYGDTPWISSDDLGDLSGSGGILNAQAALAIGVLIGLSKEAMLEALSKFRSLPHRMTSLGEVRGIEWIDDSKGTNVGASRMALRNLTKRCVWIAGGDGKQADFSPLIDVLSKKIHSALLFGQDAQLLADTLKETGMQIDIVANLDEAVEKASRLAKPGECVLLSPACASTDMYQNYIERGKHFAALVRALAQALDSEEAQC